MDGCAARKFQGYVKSCKKNNARACVQCGQSSFELSLFKVIKKAISLGVANQHLY